MFGATCHKSHATIEVLPHMFDGRLIRRNGDVTFDTHCMYVYMIGLNNVDGTHILSELNI